MEAIRNLSPETRPIVIALGFTLVILVAGTAYTLATSGTAPLLSVEYLLLQLKNGAFLGLAAAGVMLVILLGHIDLSIPWTMTAAAITAAAVGGDAAIPAGLAVGAGVGLINGFGVAWLRVPSMIFTLGMDSVMRGLMVAFTGGAAPASEATAAMHFLGTGKLLGIPMPILVWLLISLLLVLMLTRTAFGRAIYTTGNSETASYLSGIRTRLVVLGAFVGSGLCSGMAGVLLAGYSNRAYQGMGDPFLLPAIAAVVLGGTNVLGGQGRYTGTVVGVVLIVLLASVLSIMDMPEAARQVIYGVVIIAMLLVYGRKQAIRH